MTALLSGQTAPGTTLSTTTQTQAFTIPPQTIVVPPLSDGHIIIRGCVCVNTGAGVTSLQLQLRVGYNITGSFSSYPLVGNSFVIPAIASLNAAGVFEWIDGAGMQNLPIGYTIAVVQTGATGNGSVTYAGYEVDYSVM